MDDQFFSAQATEMGLPLRLKSWIRQATDEDLFRINLKELSLETGLPWKTLLDAYLKGVNKGLFQMNWEFHCPHCNGIASVSHHLHEVKTENQCGLCSVSFRNTLDTNVMVTFSIHPSVHPLPDSIQNNFRSKLLEAVKNMSAHMPEEYLSGLECLASPVFQELFGTDVLGTEESLEVSRMVFLFTDIKGSTQMYSDLGDALSYRIVREHFKLLFNAVESKGGVVVKTIGDAVMAVFIRPQDALDCALHVYDEFKERRWDPLGFLEIKMGLHSGQAIIVNLNDRVDYFGNSVNTTARIQGLAEDHTVCFTKPILDDPKAKSLLAKWIKGRTEAIYHHRTKIKGLTGEIDYYRLGVR